MPSEKRARQRAAREARLAAMAKAQRRRRQTRNSIVVVVIAAAVVGIVFLVNSGGSPGKKSATTTTTTAPKTANGRAQAAANEVAVKAGCPSDPSTRVNTLSYKTEPAITIDPNKLYSATVKTTAGTFTMSLYAKTATETVNNFVFLADKGYYTCNIFHRVIPNFMDQTGDPTGTGSGSDGFDWKIENVPTSWVAGDVAMANTGQPDSNEGQWFILVNPSALGAGQYTLFGKVTSGYSVVQTINNEGNSNASANGVPPDVIQRILKVTIHEANAASL
ncbi:MAG TPA: peptidylprolyl isomerase [Acidimicrobiales bacterium]|nr:peptidylprolyl isomerase [Acidimicrobiales bacterium]